jgi:hypothetical protein
MATNFEITELFLSFAILFCIIKVLDFYGVTFEEYALYVVFYAFILLSKFVLPTKINTI